MSIYGIGPWYLVQSRLDIYIVVFDDVIKIGYRIKFFFILAPNMLILFYLNRSEMFKSKLYALCNYE